MNEEEIKLEVRNISKTFPGTKALDDINIKILKGNVHAICGENGAGKSTLMKIISGIYKPDSGQIIIDGKEVEISNPIQAREYGISMVSQELDHVPEQTVAEFFCFGNWPANSFGKISWKELKELAEKILTEEKLPYNPDTKLNSLSLSDIQLLEIAKAIYYKSDIIIMDEPTSAISDDKVDFLFEKISSLKKSNKTIIYISHKMDEIFKIADQITILRDGKLIVTKSTKELSKSVVISMMVGRKIDEKMVKENINIGKEVLKVKNLTKRGVFSDININLREGEIVGIAGLVGAGRTEILEGIFGLYPYDEGEIYIKDQKVKISSPSDSIKHGMFMLSEDRRKFGIIPVRPVRENITISKLEEFFYHGYLHKKKEIEISSKMCKELNIKTPTLETEINFLSGGNQQKALLARCILTNSNILLLDEPTRGIDVGAKYEIYELMNSLVKKKKAILMVSSELPELLGMCDRIYVVNEGRISGELKREEFSEEIIAKLEIGYSLEEENKEVL